jgi:acetyl-CoA C-acetyltransferase/acetyl-CoA acyltransferase
VSERVPSIAGVGTTRFAADHPDDLLALTARAATRALVDADRSRADLTSVHVGSMLGASQGDQPGLANALCGALGLAGVAADTIDNTSASGASAVLRAVEAVRSGHSSTALAIGAEVMSGSTAAVTEAISRLTHRREYEQGVTLPTFGGLAAAAYFDRYEGDREALARVGVKNHHNAVANEIAQFRREITVADVLDSPMIAAPLRLYDCCPTTDGAAAILITAGDGPVAIRGTAGATGTHAVAERGDPLAIESVRTAGERAFSRAGRAPADVDVACVHDAFSILEWLELEELGFYDPGTAWEATVEGETERDGLLPVNPGGGLKARGHPLGATGVAQLIELYWQLTEALEGRQVTDAETGLALNVAGFGNNAVCTLLEAR